MIGIILSAGTGTRLRPLTENMPKPLLKIDNITIIERMVKNFMENGIKEFIFVVGHFKEKVIEHGKYLKEKYKISIEIVENKNYQTTNTSVSTYLATKNLNDSFLLVNGDNVLDPEIVKNLVKNEHTSLVVDNFKKLNEESFKIIVQNGIIGGIGKDLDIDKSTGEFIGLSKVIKKDLKEFNKILKKLTEDDSQNYYDLCYEDLSKIVKIDYIFTNGLKWSEIDDFNDWEIAQKLVKKFDNHSC
ncbi:phosphocholine cytidylyltransferase family protein [Methanobrevibacter curvatus]|nr:phosphocholine cytidylyltransferase family protein [Methanobrevibacter curvatus]